MKQDRNFDELAERFRRNIYGSDKGKIRLAVLWQHLTEQLPQLLQGKPLRILDVGCGLGAFSARLAELGHQLVLCDISSELLAEAKHQITQQSPTAQVSFFHCSLAQIGSIAPGPYDLVMCHAVLEWLAEPQSSLPSLQQLITEGGHLSLMFYNVNALVFRNLIRGNLRKAASGDYAGEKNSLTPQHPLQPEQVYQWVAQQSLQIRHKAGIRVIYDYMDKRVRERLPLAAIIEMEQHYCSQEPYLSLGRYIHLIAEKPPLTTH